MDASSLMTRVPVTCGPEETLDVVAERLWKHDCGALPVVDHEGRPIAIVTDRDVCMSAWSRGQPLHEIPVSSAMSKELHAVRVGDSPAAAASVMETEQVRRVPVVDHDGRLIGILSMADLARAAARGTDALSVNGVGETLAQIVEPHPVDAPTAAEPTEGGGLRHQLDELRTLRDSIRVRLHLARMEARDRFRAIEPKVDKLEHEILEAAEGATGKLSQTLERLARSLRSIDKDSKSPHT